MDIQLEKLEAINMLKETNDSSIIMAVAKLLRKKKKDWWDDLTDAQKEDIGMNPEIFPKSSVNKKYRKCVITKQSSFLCSFGSNEIKIYTIFDTRQDLNKIKKDIK